MSEQQLQWQDDTPRHELLTPRDQPPLIETKVSKVMKCTMEEAYAHFWGSEPRLRLELHKDHVKSYHIHSETENTLDYEFVFEAYGTRNWGKAVEVATRPDRIDVEVTEGPVRGQTISTLFEDVTGSKDIDGYDGKLTKVTQINRVWPGRNDRMVKMMDKKLRSQLAGLAGVHLEQHRHDIEGLERFQDKFSKQIQAERAEQEDSKFADFMKTTRAVALPTVLLPVIAGAALAFQQDAFSLLALILTIIGSGAALLGANLINDLYDFKEGADQSARQVPGQIETGSGAFVEGRWSTKKGWAMTAALFGIAALCGAVLAVVSTPMVLALAAAGALISYVYVGPPFPLAYKGRGLGEILIFTAFGILPITGSVLAHGGVLTPQVWWIACLYGFTSTLMLYHHHFLHWQGDKAAGKMSPIAVLGPKWGAMGGFALVLATSATAAGATYLGYMPVWGYIAAATPFVLAAPQFAAMRGASNTPAMVNMAKGAFGAMTLTGLAALIVLWL